MMLSPELMLLFELALKMLMTAAIVVVASIVVERSGPFIGALIASLPTAAGAAYIILAIEHPQAFIAVSAIGTVVANAVVAVFALAYAALAQRHGLLVSLGGALLVWSVGAAVMHQVDWTPLDAVLLNVIVFAITISASRRFRTEGSPSARLPANARDIALRAVTVAVFVVFVTTASHSIGSLASGMLAVFPVAMSSFFVILHPRIGGRAAASVAAHVQAPLIGLTFGFLAVHYLAVPIGVWWSFAVGLAICLAWNALLWVANHHRPASH
jgi:hypothetical protein